MTSPASIGKHPIHPMLVAIPIGLFVFSLISDGIAFYRHGDAFWSNVAFYTMLGGVVSALIAALPGFIDWLSIKDRKVKTIGLWHMLLNLTVVALYAINLWLRTNNTFDARLPLALSVVSILLLCVSGWLGGSLVYEHGMAVEPTPEPNAPESNRVRHV